ncbi:MAG: GTP-binding protein [Anaerolineaceae bacterium]|nr:MAG: GTP-binding protein [Anaerolineaceae bacterium]
MFIDQAEIEVKSGKGGDGMVHFHREKYVPRGGPDGGDGGRGGDVILEVRPTLNTLAAFRHTACYVAGDGKGGGTNDKTGRSADDLIVPVPPGTVVYDAASGGLIGDLTTPGQRLTVCKGGRGGRGNPRFKSSTNQAPRTAENGAPGEEKRLRLELKLIADIGIVGVPNAGKSTLLSVLTNAKPKIAAYPFTTLEPNLGVAEVDDETTVVLADIPGLIEGASQGAGLGFEFLRHIQRTRVLVHLLDGLSLDPLGDYAQTNAEMALFDPRIRQKPQIVAVNKADQPEVQERWKELKTKFKKQKVDVVLISALARTGVRELLLEAAERLAEAPPLEDVTPELPVYRPVEDPRAFTIVREPDGWRVKSAAIERAAEMTPWNQDGSVRRFQKLMERLGVDDALKKAGAQEGDVVRIGGYELEYQE